MVHITEINDPIDRFVAFIFERETIRFRRFERSDPPPWTKDPILQEYRFTNVHREDDAVSKHYQRSIRNRYTEDAIVFPATVAYRWFNRISTCDALFNEPLLDNESVFEKYINHNDVTILTDLILKLPTPHVTGSFIITGKPGFPKGEGVCHYIHQWCVQKSWRRTFEAWQTHSPLLCEMFEWLQNEGLGSFMTGQLVADLKYLPFMQEAKDWWSWATPGPGSMRGLNIVLERPMEEPWPKGQWLQELTLLSNRINPKLNSMGMERLHNQDLQNCLCEWSKYTKTVNGWGRPRQTFKHGGPNVR
jgi:hypothetical protein